MILLLNYLPWIIWSVALVLAVKSIRSKEKLRWSILYGALAVLLTLAIQALSNSSYIPRGTVEPLNNPTFDETAAVVQDRQSKPQRNSEESAEHLKELSDWRKHKQEREEQSNE